MVGGQYYHMFSYTTTLISCTLNTALIYILVVTPIRHVGPYRWLLALFAAVDICISLMHSITSPIGYLTEFGFIAIPLRFVKSPTAFGFWTMVAWVFIFFQTFILLAFHYVYRFVLLCSPSWLAWTHRRNRYRFWISVALAIDILIAGSVALVFRWCMQPNDEYRRAFGPAIMESYGIDLNATNKPGFIVMTFWIRLASGEKAWQSQTIGGVSFIGAQLIASAAVIGYCITRIMRESRKDGNLESKTRQMQRQLFRALVWQTIIPTFTTYVPIALVIVLPLVLDIAMGDWGTVAMSSVQLLPLIDPVLIFFFVPRYRAALPRFARAVFPVNTSIVKTVNSRHT